MKANNAIEPQYRTTRPQYLATGCIVWPTLFKTRLQLEWVRV
jgi:hypothetical protein